MVSRKKGGITVIRSSRGYTLIEALVTVSLLLVISVLSAPSFSSFLQRQTLRTENQSALKMFTMARANAMVVEAAETVVCWNDTNGDINIASTGTNYNLAPGDIIVAEGGLVDFGELVTRGRFSSDRNVTFDNDVDNCAGFDSQGRLTGVPTNVLSIVFCKAVGVTEDALRLEVAIGGRASVKRNDDLSGAGPQTCT